MARIDRAGSHSLVLAERIKQANTQELLALATKIVLELERHPTIYNDFSRQIIAGPNPEVEAPRGKKPFGTELLTPLPEDHLDASRGSIYKTQMATNSSNCDTA